VCEQHEALQFSLVMHRISRSPSYFPGLVAAFFIFASFQAAVALNDPEPETSACQSDAQAIVGSSASKSSEGKADPSNTPSALLIGQGDELEITVYGAPDLSQHTHVNASGNISMPLIGSVHIAGLTSSEAEGAIENRLRQDHIINDPQVSLFVKEYTNSEISVAGEVAKPGSYSVLGPHRLFDVLQAAGGPTERATNTVVISHRGQNQATTYTFSKDPAEMATSNVDLQPGDTVVVPRAGIAYVLGEVNKPGGYVMNSTGGVTVLQLVAVAGGTTHLASAGKTRLLRKTNTGFQEQQIDLKKLLRGRIHDVPVQNEDILYVPINGVKEAVSASLLVGTAATAAVYRIP
jgi:polysaccharide biosynthesis/export protein